MNPQVRAMRPNLGVSLTWANARKPLWLLGFRLSTFLTASRLIPLSRAMEDVVATRAQSAHRPIETTKPVERRPRRGDTWRGTIAKALRGVPSVVSTAQGSLVVEGGWMFVRRDCRTGRSAIRSIEVCPSHVGGRGWLECKREHLRARSTGLRRSTRHRGTGGLRHRRQGCFRSPEVCLRRLSALVGMGRMIRGRGGRFRRSRLG